MRKKAKSSYFLPNLWVLGYLIIVLFVACQASTTVETKSIGTPLESLDDPIQVAEFELRSDENGELIATGMSLSAIAQAPSPMIDGDKVQATDVLFSGTTLFVSYNFKGEPHKGALQVIDVSTPENPILQYELELPNADLNRIRMYQDRYLVVAAGEASTAATLEIFDIQNQPTSIASLDLPSRQSTMVTLYRNYALVTTGDDGGVSVIDLSNPSLPEMVAFYPLYDARYVEVLSEREVLVVNGGDQAAMSRLSWSTLTQGTVVFDENAMGEDIQLSLTGLTVGAPSWGFMAGDRFYLSADEQGLLTFSLSDESITATGTVSTQGDANAGFVDAQGRFALLANGQEGLLMLDVQDGNPTQVLAQFDTPGDRGSANAVAIKDNLVALADGLGGVKLLEAHLLIHGTEIPTPPVCEGLVYEGTFTPQRSSQLSRFCDDGYSIISEDLVVNRTGLTALNGLECLCEVRGDVKITSNASLYRLNGLNNLRLIGQSLRVNHNSSLNNFDALTSLAWIGQDLRVHSESSLGNINGLTALEVIGHDISIEGNASLRTVGSLDALTWLGNSFLVRNNSSLSSLSGFNALPWIAGQLEIVGNSSLRSINGLNQVSIIEGHFYINNNSSLQSVNGFDSLTEIVMNLSINSNPSLRSFDGLIGIERLGGNLSIRNNSSLPTNKAQALRNSIGEGIAGSVTISGNSP